MSWGWFSQKQNLNQRFGTSDKTPVREWGQATGLERGGDGLLFNHTGKPVLSWDKGKPEALQALPVLPGRCDSCSKLGQSSESTQKLMDKQRASKRSPRGSGQGTSSVYYGRHHQHPKSSSLKMQQIPSCSGPMDFCLTLPKCVIQSSLSCLRCSAPATQASPLSFRDTKHTRALGRGN